MNKRQSRAKRKQERAKKLRHSQKPTGSKSPVDEAPISQESRVPIDQESNEESGKPGLGSFKTWIETGTFLAVAIYTGLTFQTMEELKTSNRQARESMIAAQRPWLVAKELKKLDTAAFVAKDKHYVPLKVVNSGNSPAIDAINSVCLCFVDGRPGDQVLPALPPPNRQRGAMIGPNDFLVVAGRAEGVPQGTLDGVVAGTVTMYLHAKVEYGDVYGGKHWLEACYYYDPEDPETWTLCQGNNATGDYR